MTDRDTVNVDEDDFLEALEWIEKEAQRLGFSRKNEKFQAAARVLIDGIEDGSLGLPERPGDNPDEEG